MGIRILKKQLKCHKRTGETFEMNNKILALFVLAIISAGLTTEALAIEPQIVTIQEDTQVGGYFNNPLDAVYRMEYIKIGNGTFYAGYVQTYAATNLMGNVPYKATLNLSISSAPFSPEGTYDLYMIKTRYNFMKRSKYIVLSGKVAEGKIVDGKFIIFNVTSLVKSWHDKPYENFGFAVKKPNGWYVTVASTDYPLGGDFSKPYILIEPDLPPAPKAEDLNHDDKVDAWDVLIIFRHLNPTFDLGFPVPPMYDISCNDKGIICDVNKDTAINSWDQKQVSDACDNPDCGPV